MTRRIAAFVIALALLALGAAGASADHGYWPAGGVDPAVVVGHREVTDEATLAASWGDDCAALDTVAPRRDVYGVVLEADYRLAVILAGARSSNEWLPGPYGATLFDAPRAGQFLWADADGDGRYSARHEADARLLIVCPASGLPATSTSEVGGDAGFGRMALGPRGFPDRLHRRAGQDFTRAQPKCLRGGVDQPLRLRPEALVIGPSR